jgi:hypothetical protein
MMTLEQTVDIPADRRLYLELPETVPSGRTKLILNFEALPSQSAAPLKNELSPELRAAMQEAEEKWRYNKAHREEINAFRGCLKDSPIWDNLDGVAYQRKIRDEWDG